MFDHPPRVPFFAALLVLFATLPATAADFPEISDYEKTLTEVPGEPSASAVVLFKRGFCELLDFRSQESSRLEVQVRVKILTEEGVERFGEVAIAHSSWHRLNGFTGRTVLPDGRVIPVGEDAVFRDTTSRSERRYVTKAAFPAVEVGAILDYRYTLVWDTFFRLSPWYFANDVPTLYSEISYVVPSTLAANPWGWEVAADLDIVQEKHAKGTLVRAVAKNVPAVPDEPDSYPFSDLSTRFMLIPTRVGTPGGDFPLLESWNSTCDVLADHYTLQRSSRRKVRRHAEQLTAEIKDRHERIAALYRFVRDEVQTEPSAGVISGAGTLDRALADRRGTMIQKSLMLVEMLDEIKAKPELIWAANRFDGRIDPNLANPAWFDRPLVMVEDAGERVFLDPSDRRLGYGQLAPGFEGMPALVYSQRKPEMIEIPRTRPDDHLRAASLELAVDGEGRVSGSGRLQLSGHHAWQARSRETDGDWVDWLEQRFEDYDVSAVEVADERDGRSVEVTWSLVLRDEAVLGDEVSLLPSVPLGPLSHPYNLPPDRRLTPVQLAFADVDRVELVATWADGWSVEALPEAHSSNGVAGALEVAVEVDEEEKRLRYRRELRIDHIEFAAGEPYAALRQTMTAVQRSDAQGVLLVAE